ncbi:hypothetical protein BGZ89_000168 [Linnemannia elongata]|nr:hypothetical protein BGZ89_000168 [Linnemannia elongata]
MCPPPPPPNRPRSPPSNPRYFPTHIDHNEELAWAIECNYDVSPPSHARPPHPHGLQGPISTSTSASSLSQYSSVISLDEQIVQAEAIDYGISPSGHPIIFLTPATDSSSTSFSSSFSDMDEAADSDTDEEVESDTDDEADSNTDEAADSDTNEAVGFDKDEAADTDTNDTINPNLTVTPSSIAVVLPSPGTNEAASTNTNEAVSSSINGATTAAANNPVHGTSSIPSKEECGSYKNSPALLLPESSTTTTHSQGLQNPDACQIGDNEDWEILLSNLNEKDPKDVDEYRE